MSSNRDVDKFKSDAKSMFHRAVSDLKKSSATKQICMGSASGWVTGFVTMKIGKSIAFAVGGGVILLQIAQHKGYITINWDKVKEKTEETVEKVENDYAENTSGWIEKARGFARDNTCFAGGFLGGFLIGLAS